MNTTGELVVQSLILALYIAMIVHMLMIYFKKKHRTDYTVEDFKSKRIELGKPDCASQEENAHAGDQLEKSGESWAVVEKNEETGEEFRVPVKRNHVVEAENCLKTAIETCPTDEHLVQRINDLGEVLNTANKREFNGSKTLIIIAAVLAILFGVFGGGWAISSTLALGAGIYILASMTPGFILVKREINGKNAKSSFLTWILAGVFTSAVNTRATKIVTEWSDGSKTSENDYTATGIMWGLALFVTLCMAFFMGLIAVISYTRNYLMYV